MLSFRFCSVSCSSRSMCFHSNSIKTGTWFLLWQFLCHYNCGGLIALVIDKHSRCARKASYKICGSNISNFDCCLIVLALNILFSHFVLLNFLCVNSHPNLLASTAHCAYMWSYIWLPVTHRILSSTIADKEQIAFVSFPQSSELLLTHPLNNSSKHFVFQKLPCWLLKFTWYFHVKYALR